MISTKIDLKAALKQYFGFEKFKGNQEEIIQSVIDGKDTFVIMPTGGGKSLCYQLPAILSEGTAIVISPLIALMKNQVDSIRSYSNDDDIASFLNSSLNKGQMRDVKAAITAGKTKLLFIAPETLTKDENIEFFRNNNISFVAVDEAHCISEWGHDFRPEYRRIKQMIHGIKEEIPVIALTATATPKVQSDIVKNLDMEDPNIFISSFNRDNLYYEVRPKRKKEQTFREIVQYINGIQGKSGIIYVQARKTTEEIAKVLRVNDINAAPYHAGLDAKTRTRDGLPGKCLAFYSYKDIHKLEKFLRDKPVAERELSAQLMEEIIAYAETSTCRRQFLLHYFGEQFPVSDCGELCDNCKHPKELLPVQEEMVLALQAIEQLNENYTIKTLVDFVMGNSTKEMRDFKFDKRPLFAKGKDRDEVFWNSMFRQSILHNLVFKEIEQYGLLKLTDEGRAFMAKPKPISIPLNRDFTDVSADIVVADSGAGAALDKVLMDMLLDLRKSEAKRLSIQPWIIFSEPALQDMATYYPMTTDDMKGISGINHGKAVKYGKAFIELISAYVEENDIERPSDFVMKQVANKSKNKVEIIQGIDRKLPMEDIAQRAGMDYEAFLEELNRIVDSGTKLNISYYIEEEMDEDVIEEIFDYFHEAESPDVEIAVKELEEDDIEREEIQLVRIKFMSEVVN